MNKALAEFLVGVTVLLGLAGVAVLLLRFGEFSGFGRATYAVMLEIPDASGLTGASRVTLNGVPVGMIEAIRPAADPRAGVVIELQVNEDVRIPRDVAVALDRGLVGEATLALRTGPLDASAVDPGMLKAGETLRTNATGMMDQITALLDDKLEGLAGAADDFKRLSETFTRAGDRLSEVLAPRTVEDVDQRGAPANLVSAVARFDDAVRDARQWLGDDAMRADARESVRRFREILDEASNAVEAWTRTADTISREAGILGEEGTAALRDFAAAARSLDETAGEVLALAARINRGEGTAGLLATNPDLYRSLNDAAIRLERALTEAQLLFEKYRKEGIPLNF